MKYFTRLCTSVSMLLVLVVTSMPNVNAQTTPNSKNPFATDQSARFQNDIVFVGDEGCAPTEVNKNISDTGSAVESSSDFEQNEKEVWDYFIRKGLTKEETAGIMGNIAQESGFDPENIQNPGGRTKDPSGISAGWGLIQWTPGRKILDAARSAGVTSPIHELGTQLDIIWWEANNVSPRGLRNILPDFKSRTASGSNPKDKAEKAAYAWENLMEGAGDPQMANRVASAKANLDKHGNREVSGAPTKSSDDISGDCSCSIEASPGSVGKVVVIDPGHSGTTIEETDPDTGIKTSDYKNPGTEMRDMWETSQVVKQKLEEAGFTVLLTKQNEEDAVGLIRRANIANEANAAIAVSLHSTPGRFGSSSVGWVTPQEVGLYRQTGSKKKTFEDESLARISKAYAERILDARKQAEGDAKINRLDFKDRGLPATGDMSIVQLFSKVPWIYNEVGQSGFNKNKYAEGITQGILSALGNAEEQKQVGAAANCGSNVEVTGELSQVVKAYAWPKSYPQGYIKRTEAWAKVADDPKSHYVGGTVRGVRGIDCGGFVTMVMRNSGFDPGYNPKKGNTVTQMQYLSENWEEVRFSGGGRSTADLQPGDVAVNSKHTFLFVGEIEGFDKIIASASYAPSGVGGRAPMAGSENVLATDMRWFRKKSSPSQGVNI